MLASSRLVYGRMGRVTPFWAWLLQRASAVLLGPLVYLHVSTPGAARNPWVDASLLVGVLAHGYVGLWRLTIGQGVGRPTSWAPVMFALLILCMAALGVLILRTLR